MLSNGSGYFELKEDITMTIDNFRKLFTVQTNNGDYLEHVEFDLNGHTLKIDEGNLCYAYFDVWGELKIGNGTIIRNDQYGGHLFILEKEGASITFENINAYTNVTMVAVYKENQTVTVNNSSLSMYTSQNLDESYRGWYVNLSSWHDTTGFVARGDSLANVEIINEEFPESLLSGESND